MFLSNKYILANELVNKMGINIANISILRKQFEDDCDLTTVTKLNNCNFIKSDSKKLPKNIKEGIRKIGKNEFTDFSNKLPCTWITDEFGVSEREWFQSGIVIEKTKISDKNFYVFSDDFIKTVKRKIPYVLNKEETEKCFKENKIEGYIKLSKNKFMTWYDPYE